MDFVMVIIPLVILGISLAGVWKVFEKAGEAGWKALIPIYNIYIGIKISGHSGWWLLILFLPALIVMAGFGVVDGASLMSLRTQATTIGFLINSFLVSLQILWIVSAIITYNLSRSFGKGIGFTLGLSLLGFIFWPILGFGDAEYHGPAAKQTVNQGADKDSPDYNPGPSQAV